jgi:hypothetical protein
LVLLTRVEPSKLAKLNLNTHVDAKNRPKKLANGALGLLQAHPRRFIGIMVENSDGFPEKTNGKTLPVMEKFTDSIEERSLRTHFENACCRIEHSWKFFRKPRKWRRRARKMPACESLSAADKSMAMVGLAASPWIHARCKRGDGLNGGGLTTDGRRVVHEKVAWSAGRIVRIRNRCRRNAGARGATTTPALVAVSFVVQV